MASSQATKGPVSSSQLPQEHHDTHEKLKNEVVPPARQATEQTLAAKGETQDRVTAIVAIENSAQGILKFQECKDWSGQVFGIYPDQIDQEESATFTHKGKHGSEGGVIYKGPSESGGADDRAWVVVWQALGKDGKCNKVHVEAGYAENYPQGKVDWEAIRAKLKTSQEYFKDKETDDAEASAKITLDTHKPDVSVTFSIAP